MPEAYLLKFVKLPGMMPPNVTYKPGGTWETLLMMEMWT